MSRVSNRYTCFTVVPFPYRVPRFEPLVRRGIFFAQIVALCMTTCASFVLRQQGRFREGNKMSKTEQEFDIINAVVIGAMTFNDAFEAWEKLGCTGFEINTNVKRVNRAMSDLSN